MTKQPSPQDPPKRPTPPEQPAPAPVDTSEESVAGEEDPGAALEDVGDEAFNHPASQPGKPR